jgi:hypothetical protein
VLVATATTGAVAGLRGITVPGVPIDRIGMLADIGAGCWALTHALHHRYAHKKHDAHGEDPAHDPDP